MVLVSIPLMGLFVSLVSVFLGLGGGILLVPLLPWFFAISVHESVATSLLAVFLIVLENTYRFHIYGQKLIRWPVVILMGPVSALVAIVSAWFVQKWSAQDILMVLMIVLLLVAFKTLLSSFLSNKHKTLSWGLREKLFSVVAGVVAGMTSGFAGVGSGVILSPAMILLRVVSPRQLAPTANANVVCTTLGACLCFLVSGSQVAWNQWGLIRLDIAVGIFVCASFFGCFLRPYQDRLPLALKSLLLSVLLFCLSVKILYFDLLFGGTGG